MNCKKSDFLLDKTAAYLNCAYMSPQLKKVEEAGIKGIQRKRNPFRIPPEQFFGETDELREEFSRLINAEEPKRIAVVPAVSYGMANVANNLPISAGDQILVAGEQFPSNVYPWRSLAKRKGAEVVTVSPPADQKNRGKTWNERILEAITSKTKLVALGNIHWADGTLFDLKSIRTRTRETGAWLAVDGTQSVGALPFDVQEIQPDILVCAGYKWLMGPYSIGLAWYGPALDEGNPIEENWINRYESENFAALVNYNDNYQPGALRYEVGEHSNFILVPMMLAAVKQLNEWGVENIQNYCRNLIAGSVANLREKGFIIEDEKHRSSHLFGVRLAKHHNMTAIKAALDTQNIIVSYRGDSIRVSPNVYNNRQEIESFARILISSANA
ncbi:MAG: aminotransferase class V-fold PLP-dependent enzyme [Balneolaceae bacterium]